MDAEKYFLILVDAIGAGDSSKPSDGIRTKFLEQTLKDMVRARETADALVDDKKANQKVGDVNDTMYIWNASRNFDPTPKLGDITAKVLLILSQDDERNPVELPTLKEGIPKIANGSVYIVPEDDETKGHGTTYDSAYYAYYAAPLGEFLASLPNAPQ